MSAAVARRTPIWFAVLGALGLCGVAWLALGNRGLPDAGSMGASQDDSGSQGSADGHGAGRRPGCDWPVGERIAVKGTLRYRVPTELVDRRRANKQATTTIGLDWRLESQTTARTLGGNMTLIGRWQTEGAAGPGAAAVPRADVPVRMTIGTDCTLQALSVGAQAKTGVDEATSALRELSFRDAMHAAAPVRDLKAQERVRRLPWERTADGVTASKGERSDESVDRTTATVKRSAAHPWFDTMRTEYTARSRRGAKVYRLWHEARTVAPEDGWSPPQVARWLEGEDLEKRRKDEARALRFNPEGLDLSKLSVADIQAYRERMQKKGWKSWKRNELLLLWLEANPDNVAALLKAVDDRKLNTQWDYLDAVSVLARHGDERSLKRIQEFLDDPKTHPQLRAQAATSMVFDRKTPPARIVDDFIRISKETSDWPGQRITQQLGMSLMGSLIQHHGKTSPALAAKAEAAIRARLADTNATPKQLKAALMGVGNAQRDSLYPSLAQHLDSPEVEVRAKAWDALRGMSLAKLEAEFETLSKAAGRDRVKRLLLYRTVEAKLRSAKSPTLPDVVLKTATAELSGMQVDGADSELVVTLIHLVGRSAAQGNNLQAASLLKGLYVQAIAVGNVGVVKAVVQWLGKQVMQ